MKPTIHRIRQSFTTLRKEEKLRHRDIAIRLAISEGELIAAHVGLGIPSSSGLRAIRLAPQWPEIIASVELIGEVMALTRNEACVHEKTGRYRNASHEGMTGLLIGEIDLRIFYQHWHAGFAVTQTSEHGDQRSFQFFDAQGQAVHKIYVRPQSDIAAYDRIISLFASSQQESGLDTVSAKPKSKLKPDNEIDIVEFWQAWRNLKDTHDFYSVLMKFALTRTQALRLAEPEFVTKVSNNCLKNMLQQASQSKIPIMIFVSNPGVMQIHTGPIHHVVEYEPWINVMDPRFNLHLRQDWIESAWIVRKPTVDGIVTSIEFFDHRGDAIAMFFGERKPGKSELQSWRDLVIEIEGEYGLVEVKP